MRKHTGFRVLCDHVTDAGTRAGPWFLRVNENHATHNENREQQLFGLLHIVAADNQRHNIWNLGECNAQRRDANN